MADRYRKHQYSSWTGYIPTGTFWMLASLVTFPITFFAAVDKHWTALGAHVGLIIFFAVGRPIVIPWLRRPKLNKVAKELGLQYQWKGNLDWLPHDYLQCPDEQYFRNILQGELNEVSVLVFDNRVERTCYTHDMDDIGSDSRTSTRSEYSVVQLTTQTDLPGCLIAEQGQLGSAAYPIAGTKYYLSPGSAKNKEQAARLITDEVVSFLEQFPGLVIEINRNQLTALDVRRFTNKRRTAGNLPALLEDLITLQSMLIAGLNSDLPRTHFSLADALEKVHAQTSEYLGDSIYPLHGALDDSPVKSFGAFGLLWTTCCFIGFPLLFINGAFEEAGVLYFFAPIFTLAGLAMLAPWVIKQVSQPSQLLSDPVIRVRGDVPKRNGRLHVHLEQKNESGADLEKVTLNLQVAQRTTETDLGQGRSSIPILYRMSQQAFLNLGHWNRAWYTEKKYHLGTIPAGESIELENEFQFSNELQLESPGKEWWGIDVEVHNESQPLYAASYWLTPPAQIGSTLMIPGVIFGGVWGFFCSAIFGVMLFESISEGDIGLLFGVVVLMAFGGAIGGAILGGKLAFLLRRRPLIRPFAELWEQVHFLYQFLISFVTAGASFFISLHIAGDVYNLFGWQKPDQAIHQGADQDNSNQNAISPKLNVIPKQFIQAVEKGDLQTMKQLFKQNRQLLNMPVPPAGGTALHRACVYNRPEMVEWLVENGANLEATNRNQATPLHIAAYHGRLKLAKILITSGANSKAENRGGKTPYELAKIKRHQPTANYLKQNMQGK